MAMAPLLMAAIIASGALPQRSASEPRSERSAAESSAGARRREGMVLISAPDVSIEAAIATVRVGGNKSLVSPVATITAYMMANML